MTQYQIYDSYIQIQIHGKFNIYLIYFKQYSTSVKLILNIRDSYFVKCGLKILIQGGCLNF